MKKGFKGYKKPRNIVILNVANPIVTFFLNHSIDYLSWIKIKFFYPCRDWISMLRFFLCLSVYVVNNVGCTNASRKWNGQAFNQEHQGFIFVCCWYIFVHGTFDGTFKHGYLPIFLTLRFIKKQSSDVLVSGTFLPATNWTLSFYHLLLATSWERKKWMLLFLNIFK